MESFQSSKFAKKISCLMTFPRGDQDDVFEEKKSPREFETFEMALNHAEVEMN